MHRSLLTTIALLASVMAARAADPSPHAINTQPAGDEPPAATALVRGITVPEGFRVALFAAEPDVAQPIAITTDARGRLWVVENYSYPEWRSTGTDRVLIFEDTDGHGRFDSRKVFFDGGRNLTGAGRAETDYVILNVMDPSAVVPEAWRLTQVITADGRVIAGAVAASDERTLTLRTTTGEIQLDRQEIDEVVTREQSVMPEGLWNGLTDEEVRDLVAYLASPTQVPLPTP
jgi:putative heme-binding domain-containing protein